MASIFGRTSCEASRRLLPRRMLLSVPVGLWCFLGLKPLYAQANPPLHFPDSSPLSDLLQGNASFRLVLGRILLDNKRYRVGQFRFKNSDEPERTDNETLRTLSIALEHGQPNLSLYRSNKTERWMLEARSNGRCRIQFANTAADYKITWEQAAHGQIQIEMEHAGSRQSYETMSVWHLKFEQEEFCERHVFPMLLRVEPNWNFELIASETEERLLEALQLEPQVTQRETQELLHEFTSNQASTRDKAHRELRQRGLAILPHLTALELQNMEPEQRLRIQRLIQTLNPTTDDTPNRLAAWLAGDYGVCQRVASKLEGEAKKQGFAYLQGLAGDESDIIIR